MWVLKGVSACVVSVEGVLCVYVCGAILGVCVCVCCCYECVFCVLKVCVCLQRFVCGYYKCIWVCCEYLKACLGVCMNI